MARTLLPASLALALLAACNSDTGRDPIPLDRLAFPGSVAVHDGRLLVVSQNFDLLYETGSLVEFVEPAADSYSVSGGVRIANFGGEIAIGDMACGFPDPVALVPSRATDELYKVTLDPTSGPICGAGCVTSVDAGGFSDAYGVGLSCPVDVDERRVWVGYLRGSGWVAAVSINEGGALGAPLYIDTGTGNARSFAYDAETNRIYFTVVNALSASPLRWIELGGGCSLGRADAGNSGDGGCRIGQESLAALEAGARGVEPKGIALSNPQAGMTRRAYVTVAIYDAELAADIDDRPSFDLGGELWVIDITEGPLGNPEFDLVRTLPIGLGAAEVRVLPVRSGLRDVVAVTAKDDGRVWIYDDETGGTKLFERNKVTGNPVLGSVPFGLAVQDRGAGIARVYVGSFGDDYVTPIDVPLDSPGTAEIVPVRIGGSP